MTKIPEDVMNAASDAHLATIGRGTSQAVQIIAIAIMAERKRCVDTMKIATGKALRNGFEIGFMAGREVPSDED